MKENIVPSAHSAPRGRIMFHFACQATRKISPGWRNYLIYWPSASEPVVHFGNI